MAQVRATVPANPFVGVMVRVEVFKIPAPRLTVISGPTIVTLGAETMVIATTVEACSVPEVPVIVTVVVVGVGLATTAAEVAVKVTICVPATDPAAKVAVTPAGRPLAANVGVPLNPPIETSVTVLVALVVCGILSVAGAAFNVKLGGTLTVSMIGAEPVTVPETPEIVIVTGPPMVAVVDAASVNVDIDVTGLVLNVAVTPLGRPATARVTAPVKPFVPLSVIPSFTEVPCTSVMLAEAGVIVNDGPGVTVSATAVEAISVPDTPLIVTVDIPAAALVAAVKVTTLEAVAGLVANTAVTPAGRPDADNMTGPLKPLVPLIVIVFVAFPLCATEIDAEEDARVKVGGRLTVTVTVVLEVTLPETPLIVTVYIPVVAVEDAVKVTILEVVAGLVANAAVTPAGRPVAERVTDPVKPPVSVMLMVLLALAPCATVTEAATAASENPGAAATVTATEVVCAFDAEVPVIVTLTGPAMAAVLDAVRVSVLDPPDVGLGLNDPVTPAGNPLTEKVTAPGICAPAVTVSTSVALLPCVTETLVLAGLMVKLGGGVMVRAITVLAILAPETPVMVTLTGPATVAVALAASVRTLVPLVGFVSKVAVTPAGSPVAASVALPVKPP
jgi:hypothetical protein